MNITRGHGIKRNIYQSGQKKRRCDYEYNGFICHLRLLVDTCKYNKRIRRILRRMVEIEESVIESTHKQHSQY